MQKPILHMDALGGHEPFQVLGQGTASTVYKIDTHTSSSRTELCLKTGYDSALLEKEFEQWRDIYRLYSRLANSAAFMSSCGSVQLPRIPLYHEFHESEDECFWKLIKPRIECRDDEVVSGIVMDRIPSMPPAVGTMLIRRYFDEDRMQDLVRRGAKPDFLIHLLFGRIDAEFNTRPVRTESMATKTTTRTSTWQSHNPSVVTTTTNSSTSSSTCALDRTMNNMMKHDSLPVLTTLSNLPAPLPLIKSEIPKRAWKLVASIAAGYAFMHWGCHVDGSGTEFVLGNHSSGVRVWMLDFDKCQVMNLPPKKSTTAPETTLDGIILRLVPILMDGGHVPNIGEEQGLGEEDEQGLDVDEATNPNNTKSRKQSRRFDDETLWDTWRKTYISIGQFCAKYTHRRDLAQGPEMVCDAIEIAATQHRMGVSNNDDMIIFEDDNETGQEDLGWGSDDDEYEQDEDDDSTEEDSDEEDDSVDDQDCCNHEQNEEHGIHRHSSINNTGTHPSDGDSSDMVRLSWEENLFPDDSDEPPTDTPDCSSESEAGFVAANIFGDHACPMDLGGEDWEGLVLPDPLDPEEFFVLKAWPAGL